MTVCCASWQIQHLTQSDLLLLCPPAPVNILGLDEASRRQAIRSWMHAHRAATRSFNVKELLMLDAHPDLVADRLDACPADGIACVLIPRSSARRLTSHPHLSPVAWPVALATIEEGEPNVEGVPVLKVLVDGEHVGYVPERCHEHMLCGPARLVDCWLVLGLRKSTQRFFPRHTPLRRASTLVRDGASDSASDGSSRCAVEATGGAWRTARWRLMRNLLRCASSSAETASRTAPDASRDLPWSFGRLFMMAHAVDIPM